MEIKGAEDLLCSFVIPTQAPLAALFVISEEIFSGLNPIIVILLSEFVVEIVMFIVILVMLSEEKPSIWMFPNAEVAPAVTWEIIAARLMVAVAIGRRLTGVNWSPASASLPTHNALGRVCELYLRCPIEQREGPARLVLDANTLALPIAENQPDMLDWFEEEARRRMPLEEPTPERSTTARVRERLRALGPWQSTDAHDIARDVGMSRRTLFRKLRSEGSSLQGLRDELRQEAAEELLRETSHDHGTIGTMLGFSDGRAFARAFRRWTGSSPTDWRAGHATGEGH